ncbi:MAG: hypothetical protein GYA14_12300 [Ignavibacteria bacterium]|nr:hypothetical protein [Ignavibacteria bacterium]
MGNEQFDLFLILLKLKSYLISLIDHPSMGIDSVDYTEEFLDRKFPDRKEEILELLNSFNIKSDSEIAFDEKIHHKFKEMVKGKEKAYQLSSILEKLNIDSIQDTIKDKTIEEIKLARDEKLKEIVSILLQLARIWAKRSEIEGEFDSFSVLDEEELIRPEEEELLNKLDKDTSASFDTITQITHLYIEELIEYYFKFGGDVSLSKFINQLEELKHVVKTKYKELFKQSGLDPQNI